MLVWSPGCSVSASGCQVNGLSILWQTAHLQSAVKDVFEFCLRVVCFSTDESATENILKAELTMASLCGRLGLVTPRDAFITAICKASLPPHYALTVLCSNAANLSSKGTQALMDSGGLWSCVSMLN